MSKTGMQDTIAAKETSESAWATKIDPSMAEKQKMLQTINFKLGNFDDENRTFTAIGSTPMQDRQGDSIDQSGWILENFIKNPVIPWAHSYNQLPVARATSIGVVDGNLQFTYQAPPEGLYPFADTVWEMYRHQFMFAFSVGFIPLAYDGNWEDGYNFTECELLEISAVPVPANAGALVLAQKMGIMDNKQAKQMISKVELALKNFKDANGMTKDTKVAGEVEEESTDQVIDGKKTSKVTKKTEKTTEEVVKDEDKPVTMKELRLLLADILVEKDADTTSDEELDSEKEVEDQVEEASSNDEKGLTNNDNIVQNDNMTEQKSGAKLSADTKTKIKEVMDGLKDVMDSMQTHHDSLSALYNVGTDSEGSPEDGNSGDEDTDGQKSVETSKPKADEVNEEVVAEVKSAENDSEDGAEQEDEGVEESEEEAPEAVVKTVEEVKTEEDLIDPENLTDEQVAEIAKAVQAELDKEEIKE